MAITVKSESLWVSRVEAQSVITRVLPTSMAPSISRTKVGSMRILPSCSEGVRPCPGLLTWTTDQRRFGEVSLISSGVGFSSSENTAMPVCGRAGNCTGAVPMRWPPR